MKVSLIICTYQRAQPLLNLLNSVSKQSLYPNEILIIDGSVDYETKELLAERNFKHLTYFKVSTEYRGLTRQRNYGISKVTQESGVVCFLDDDTILDPDYFKEVVNVFKNNTRIAGVGGVATNENRWIEKEKSKNYHRKFYYDLDGYVVKEGFRNVVRNYLGLQSPELPGIMPDFSHGRTYSYPLSGKNYPVDLLVGMSFSFRKEVVDTIKFSTYFEGYGLYEDADFSIRALGFGINVICTNARLEHHHAISGRPNQFRYGKMVARNGWYVWRVKFSNPSLKATLNWHLTFILLMKIRFLNVLTGPKRAEAFTEACGRLIGWLSLFYKSPKIVSK